MSFAHFNFCLYLFQMRKKESESCHGSTIINEINKNQTATMTTTTTTDNENSPQNQTNQTIATHDSTTQTICKQDSFRMVSCFSCLIIIESTFFQFLFSFHQVGQPISACPFFIRSFCST